MTTKSTVKGADQAAAFFRAFAVRFNPMVDKHVQRTAGYIVKDVRRRYMRYTGTPSGIGADVMLAGKEYGRLSQRPSRRPMALESVMQRIGAQVIKTKMMRGKRPGWRIQVDPRARHPHRSRKFPGGVPLWLIAYQQEARKPQAVPVTHLMRTYLRIIREKRGGYGTRKRSAASKRNQIETNFRTGGQVIMQPPIRPVWSPAIKRMSVTLLAHFLRPLAMDVTKLARRYGGKTASS